MNADRRYDRYPLRGYSTIELMVAVTVGLLVMLGVLGLFVTNKRVYNDTQLATELQENGRYALEYLLRDLRHAYFFGETHYHEFETDGDAGSPSNSIFVDSDRPNCDGANAVFVFNDKSNPASSPLRGEARLPAAEDNDVTANAIGCIDDAYAIPGIPSDILIIKSATPTPITSTDDLIEGTVYIASNRSDGFLRLLTSGTTMPSISDTCRGSPSQCLPFGTYWPYHFAAYYVLAPSDGDPRPAPALARKVMEWDDAEGMGLVTEDLVEGVEGMRFLYGVATDDALPIFENAEDVGNWEDVVAVKVYLLLRTIEPDRNYTDNKAYTLGDVTVTAAQGTHYHRAVLSTTVMLRNKPIVDQ